MSEKYGFVYIWYDRKHKRYYIGCHWGTEDDGYICSSKWMKKAYKRRPQDFKRKILNICTNRKDLLDEEYKWLQLIEEEELGKKYYNIRNYHYSHWSYDDSARKTISQKLSHSLKGKRNSPESEFKNGEHRSPKTEFKKGQEAHNKDKSLEELYGFERGSQLRKTLSERKLGKNISPKTEFKKGQNTGSSNINARKVSTSNGTFDTLIEAVKYHNISKTTLYRRLKSDKWPKWKYL